MNKLKYRSPKTVDFNINGICNLNCKWCWGPAHDIKESITLEQWKNLACTLKNLGTQNIIFTGGEPLLKKDLPELTKYIHSELKMRTTLSSNGILLVERGRFVLPYINDLGLPLDGHNLKINAAMRRGTPLHFSKALNAINFTQTNFPEITLTVRTVVTPLNMKFVHLIGKTLLQSNVNPKNMRWKLYQISPIGINKEGILKNNLLITKQQFEKIVEKTKASNHEFYIEAQPYEKSIGRYFHIYPDGKSYVLAKGKDGLPYYLMIGNIVENFENVIYRVNEELNFNKNSIHGKN